ncbi:collagen alpha-1(II) chain-like [Pongo abelii]|uniref:collagen alpha-1(II) chain-like n=1 Tax=Pongo abelii TaxID=9601 RepID=UPI0023E7CBB3|nr:translation initiation factor IF-2-like [Pongo abelii]
MRRLYTWVTRAGSEPSTRPTSFPYSSIRPVNTENAQIPAWPGLPGRAERTGLRGAARGQGRGAGEVRPPLHEEVPGEPLRTPGPREGLRVRGRDLHFPRWAGGRPRPAGDPGPRARSPGGDSGGPGTAPGPGIEPRGGPARSQEGRWATPGPATFQRLGTAQRTLRTRPPWGPGGRSPKKRVRGGRTGAPAAKAPPRPLQPAALQALPSRGPESSRGSPRGAGGRRREGRPALDGAARMAEDARGCRPRAGCSRPPAPPPLLPRPGNRRRRPVPPNEDFRALTAGATGYQKVPPCMLPAWLRKELPAMEAVGKVP